MFLDENFREKIEKKIKAIDEKRLLKYVKEAEFFYDETTMNEATIKEDVLSLMHEDSCYVFGFLNHLGYKKVLADSYCSKCEKEVEKVWIDTDTLEWICPYCKTLTDQ